LAKLVPDLIRAAIVEFRGVPATAAARSISGGCP